MTIYYEFPEQLAEKWSNAGLSEERSRSASRNPSSRGDAPPKQGLETGFISLKLSNMPKDVTIQQIWKAFSPKGSIHLIEIFDPSPRETTATGRIDFEPQPKNNFWQNRRIDVALPGHENPVTFNVGVRHEAVHSTEEQRSLPVISMQLKSLDFGSLLNEDTMVIGETINSMEDGDLSLDLNTRRGEVTIHFRFPEKQNLISRKRQYKLVTPLSAIKKV
ncbi:RNA-dependent RNA polymerase [Akanthomyces lecanii RCEF 1005]|uniref:RNA-dependent RNA polymerase n=1 Tax=Akanthomyces lecanii RCEF 1005 TaxID=1081108 RepID=A0A168FPG4_CORDF|nr:RNA-dependent RNA polymerase [Akanthomyces lecanii RCEF 1005]